MEAADAAEGGRGAPVANRPMGLRLEKIILVLLLVALVLATGLFLAFFVPPGQVPDEPAHIARIESLLHGEITGHRVPGLDAAGRAITLSGVVINEAPFTVGHLFGDLAAGRKMTAALQQRLESFPWSPLPSFVFAPNTAVYFPVFYLPAALGMGLGRLHGLTPYGAILVARVANLLAYLVVASFALALARRGWRLMFAALSLPMTVWLAASCNQDGLLIASTCLAGALLTRAEAPRGASYWGAAAVFACVIAVKPAYLPLAAFMLLPCAGRTRRDWTSGGAAMAAVAVPGIIWALVTLRYVSGPLIWGAPYHPGPLWPGAPDRWFAGSDPAAQTLVLLHHPSLVFTLPLQTLRSTGLLYVQEAVGILGTLNLVMADAIYPLWYGAIVIALLGDVLAPRGAWRPNAVAASIGLLAVAATVIAIFDLEYLTWTQVGDGPLIQGVQGRYAIPLLPMIAIALPLLRLPFSRRLGAAFALPVVAMAAVGMIYLPAIVLETYYLR
jgi:hypothetical protein